MRLRGVSWSLLRGPMRAIVQVQMVLGCGAVEDGQGVLTLFCSGAAQVCHALRVNELRE